MSVSRRRRARTAVVLTAAAAALFVGAVAACSSFSGADPGTADAAPEGAAFDAVPMEEPDARLITDGGNPTDAVPDDGGLFAVCSSPTVIFSDTFRRYAADDFTNEASANSWTALDAPDPAGPTFTLLAEPGDAGFKGLEIAVEAGATAAQFLHKNDTDGHRAYCVTLHAQISASTAGGASRMELLGLRLISNGGQVHLISFGLEGAAPQLALRTIFGSMPATSQSAGTAFDNQGAIHDFYLVVDLDRQKGALYIDPTEAGVPTPTLEVSYDGGSATSYVLELGASPVGGAGTGVGATTLTAGGVRLSAQ